MAKYKLLLPKMGESVAEATIIKWLKNPGDYIEADEAVLEIATDKVDSEVPSPVAGKLVLKMCQEDEVVQVGSIIGIIETDVTEAQTTVASPAPAQPAAFEQPKPVEVPAPAPVVDHVEQPVTNHIETPVEEPEVVNHTEQLAPEQLVTGPAHVEQPAVAIPGLDQLPNSAAAPVYANGTNNTIRFYSPLVKAIAQQENVTPGELDRIQGTGSDGRLTKDDLVAYIQRRHTGPQPEQQPLPEVSTPVVEPVQEAPAPVVEGSIAAEGQHTEDVATEATPAEAEGPAIEELIAEGEPVTEGQPVADEQPAEGPQAEEAEPQPQPEAAEPAPKAAPKPAVSISGDDEIIEMDRMRRLIADHMVFSKHISPHVTSFVEADVTNIVNWRERVKNSFEKREGEKITYTPIFIEAVVKALKDMPMVNVSVDGTRIIKKKHINISMATALPNGNLIVPVIKNADELSLVGLTKAVNDLAARARGGKLLPDDIKDGTFTITNVGTFGNVMGTPIINQPQAAILAVGAIKKKPAVIETPQGDMIGIRHMMFLSLSYDHRVIDGMLGGSFLRKIADYMEQWDGSREH